MRTKTKDFSSKQLNQWFDEREMTVATSLRSWTDYESHRQSMQGAEQQQLLEWFAVRSTWKLYNERSVGLTTNGFNVSLLRKLMVIQYNTNHKKKHRFTRMDGMDRWLVAGMIYILYVRVIALRILAPFLSPPPSPLLKCNWLTSSFNPFGHWDTVQH